MPHELPQTYRSVEDIDPAEAGRLRRVAFLAAADLSGPVGSPVLLDEIQERVLSRGRGQIEDRTALRLAVAQAIAFRQENGRPPYVPATPLLDTDWLIAVMRDFGFSDCELALALRLHGSFPREVLEEARSRAGLPPTNCTDLHDTVTILEATPGPHAPSVFLDDRTWLTRRVVDLDMSDAEIAAEIGLAGVPCDRSTVRSYRRKYALSRPRPDHCG